MREEPVVVAACAVGAHAQLSHAECAGLFGEQRAKVDIPLARGGPSGELFENIGSYAIAASADRGSEMHVHICRSIRVTREPPDTATVVT